MRTKPRFASPLRGLVESSVFALFLALALASSVPADDSGLRLVWKKKIGSGYSGVVTRGEKAVTMYSDGRSDVLAAFDVKTGQTLWTHAFADTYKGHDGSHDGPISTPALADGRVFGLGPRGDLFAVDETMGEEIWAKNLAGELAGPPPPYGFGTSPIVVDDVLIVGLGGEGKAVIGFDAATGEKRWASGTDLIFYQSPISVTLAGQPQVVASGNRAVHGLDAKTGKILWQYPHEGTGGRGGFTLVPVPYAENQLFLAHDEASSKMIEVSAGAGEFGVDLVWQARAIRNTYAGPIAHGGYLYGYSSRILTCADGATGELKWRSRDPGDGFTTLAGDRLVLLTKKGSVHLAEATAEAYRELAELAVLDDLVWTPPSFSQDSQGRGQIYVRSLGEIARLELTGESRNESSREMMVRAPLPESDDSAFSRFLAEVNAAAAGDKAGLVDRFLTGQKFPLVEGQRQVHFVYRGEATDVALYGEMFGLRTEQPMARLAGTDLFHYSLEVEADARLAYAFIKDFDGIPDPLNLRRTRMFFLNQDREMAPAGNFEMSWFSMPGWSAPTHLEPASEARRGRLESHSLESKVFSRKVDLEVYLPRGYEQQKDRRYPVAYVFGMGARQQSGIPNSLDRLIGKSVEPLLVVFVGLDLPPFAPLAQLPAYEKALVEEVVPFIDGQFNTSTAARDRATLGNWFAGYLALSSSLRHADVFGKFAVQSVFLTEATLSFFDTLLSGGVEGPLPKGYVGWGQYDLRSHQEPVDFTLSHPRLVEMLQAKGISVLGDQDRGGTGWLSWSPRNDRVFTALFPRIEHP